MAEITWTAEAQQWLENIFEYIAEDNPQAAARTVQAIYERAQDLIEFPQMATAMPHPLGTCAFCFMSSIESPIYSRTMETSIFSVSFTARSISVATNSE